MKRIIKYKFVILLVIATCSLGNVRRVPTDYPTIQAAIDDCNDGDTVLVAPGTYTGDGNRDIEFKGKAITVKSEDGPQTCIFDCQGVEDKPHRGFYFHNGEDANSIVQGFTITNGWGVGCSEASPLIADCLITENSRGGVRCAGSNSTIIRCHIRNNYSEKYGGGIYIDRATYQPSMLTLINCEITGNNSGYGGGVYCYGSRVDFINCTISGNRSRAEGGGIYFSQGGSGNINNSILYGNEAPIGREIMISYVLRHASPPENPLYNITHSVVGSDPNAVKDNPRLISGEWLCVDPLFAKPGFWDSNGTLDDLNDDFWVEGDYHLKSQAGRWDQNTQSWVNDKVTSPCIDAGDLNSSIGDEPIPNGCRINMGAFGGTSQASMTLWDVNMIIDQARGPIPADGTVGIEVDLDIVLSWITDPNAVAHEVYFGLSDPPPFILRQLETEYYPGTLEPDTQYYWRIDEIDGLCNVITGPTWRFMTGPPPSRATNPIPVNGAVKVELDATLSWSPGLNAVLHDVYLGTDFNDVNNATTTNVLGVLLSQEQDSNFYDPVLKPGQTYYWRVDEIDSQGSKTTGLVWIFTTLPPKGRTCFTSETLVWIDGAAIPISEVATEQNVRHLNISCKVETLQEHKGTFACYDVLLDSGNCITVAGNHFFMMEAGFWLSLHQLKADMRLKTSKGSIGIKYITKKTEPYIGKVYNLKIKDSDRYIIGEDAVIVRDY